MNASLTILVLLAAVSGSLAVVEQATQCTPTVALQFAACGSTLANCTMVQKGNIPGECTCLQDWVNCVDANPAIATCPGFVQAMNGVDNACRSLLCNDPCATASPVPTPQNNCTLVQIKEFAQCGNSLSQCVQLAAGNGPAICVCYTNYLACISADPLMKSCPGWSQSFNGVHLGCAALKCATC